MEGFHNRLKNLATSSHWNIREFFNVLIEENHKCETDMRLALENGLILKKKTKKEQKKDDAISNLIKLYKSDSISIDDYLYGLEFNIKL